MTNDKNNLALYAFNFQSQKVNLARLGTGWETLFRDFSLTGMSFDTPYFPRTGKQAAEFPKRDSAKSDRDTDMNEAAKAIASMNASSPRSNLKRYSRLINFVMPLLHR